MGADENGDEYIMWSHYFEAGMTYTIGATREETGSVEACRTLFETARHMGL
jgi:hypothetical protein